MIFSLFGRRLGLSHLRDCKGGCLWRRLCACILWGNVLRSVIKKHVFRPHTRVSSFPRLISVAQVNEQRTTNVTRVLKAPGAELCQNACDVAKKQKIFCSHQYSPVCSMNKFRTYLSTDTCFVFTRTHQCGSQVVPTISTSNVPRMLPKDSV